jgi:hypothetical protein
VADVGPFEDINAWVLPQLPSQLTIADIDGVDFARTMLEKAVGEATRGRAHIESDLAGNDDFKGSQRSLQFEPATADEWMVISFKKNVVLIGDRYTGFIDHFAVNQDFARHDQPTGALSARSEASAKKGQIEALFIGSRH